MDNTRLVVGLVAAVFKLVEFFVSCLPLGGFMDRYRFGLTHGIAVFLVAVTLGRLGFSDRLIGISISGGVVALARLEGRSSIPHTRISRQRAWPELGVRQGGGLRSFSHAQSPALLESLLLSI